jgi:hypothetical protein
MRSRKKTLALEILAVNWLLKESKIKFKAKLKCFLKKSK